MKKIMIAAVLTMCAVPAMAGQVLWRDIEVGMTPEQVLPLVSGKISAKAKYTDVSKFPMTSSCTGYVSVKHPKGTVEKISIYSTNSDSECSETLKSSLIGKYGQPVITETTDTFQSLQGRPPTVVLNWTKDGVSVVMMITQTFLFGAPTGYRWDITYKPVESANI